MMGISLYIVFTEVDTLFATLWCSSTRKKHEIQFFLRLKRLKTQKSPAGHLLVYI